MTTRISLEELNQNETPVENSSVEAVKKAINSPLSDKQKEDICAATSVIKFNETLENALGVTTSSEEVESTLLPSTDVKPRFSVLKQFDPFYHNETCDVSLSTEMRLLKDPPIERDSAGSSNMEETVTKDASSQTDIELIQKATENKYKEIIQGYEKTLSSQMIALDTIFEKYNIVKGQLTTLEMSSEDLKQNNTELTLEVCKLTEIVRSLEIKHDSLTTALEQKTQECAQYAALCEDFENMGKNS